MKYFLIIFALTYSTYVYPSDTSSARYFPLKTGNSWTYNYLRYIYYPYYYETGTIRRDMNRDSIINGKKYFYFHWYGFDWMRYDSSNGNLVFRSASGSCSNYSGEKIYDSLSSGIGNINYCQHQATYTRACTDTSVQTIFNLQKQTKEFKHDGLYQEFITYAKDFGLTDYCGGEPPPCTYFEWLKGCVINEVVYGDTTLSDIKRVNSNIPEKLYLSQNFPNPFNPETKIKFDIPKSADIKLIIFDILGRQVSALVSERLSPGSYEYTFSGSGLPGGIYFYTLRAGEFNETKRMVLLK